MKHIRVLLVEDHFLARAALCAVLADAAHISVVGEARDGEEGIAMFRSLRPDVVILDLHLPRMSGFEVMTRLIAENSRARIVVLSNYQGREDIYRAVRAGAMSYLTKDAGGDQLIAAVESASDGIRYMPREALDRVAERVSAFELTTRESEVLVSIAYGRSNREIAQRLGIAEKTVRMHVSSVLAKMGVRDRTQATLYALQHGFVHLE